MARQVHTPTVALGAYGDYSPANSADYAYLAADVGNKEEVKLTGKELVVARNVGAGAQTITITSSVDEKGRLGDVSAYSLGAGEFAVFGPFLTPGWIQTGGLLFFEASSTDIEFAVIKLP